MICMSDWAKKEVELACRNEEEYGCACYESALKAYLSLIEDEHSGFSFNITKNILIKLMNNIPLTPIENIDENWCVLYSFGSDTNKHTTYQCVRRSSLFKDVFSDGHIKYTDNRRVICIDNTNPSSSWTNSFITKAIDKLYPITFPYAPDAIPYVVKVIETLYDEENGGDFDTLHVVSVTTPSGKEQKLNKFYKETSDGWTEIGRSEYYDRLNTLHDKK